MSGRLPAAPSGHRAVDVVSPAIVVGIGVVATGVAGEVVCPLERLQPPGAISTHFWNEEWIGLGVVVRILCEGNYERAVGVF